MQLLHSDNTINLETTEQQAGPALLIVHLQQRMTYQVSHTGYSVTYKVGPRSFSAARGHYWIVVVCIVPQGHTDAMTIFASSFTHHLYILSALSMHSYNSSSLIT